MEITFKGKTKNAKSTISIMALGIKQGSTIDVAFSGEDEQQACEAIEALVAANFNE